MHRLLAIILALLVSVPSSALAFKVHYYDTDATGTPVAIEDSDGNQVRKGEYYPFGEERSIQPTPDSSNRRLIGKEKDDETGLTYFDARYMDATTGRFLAPDPVRAVDEFTSATNAEVLTQPQRFNRYAYGLNNPYRYVDPDGEWVMAVGAVVGGLANYYANEEMFKSGKITRWELTKAVSFGAGVGALSTVLPGTTGAVLSGAIGAGTVDVYNQSLTESPIDIEQTLDSMGWGALGGYISGLGSNLGRQVVDPKGNLIKDFVENHPFDKYGTGLPAASYERIGGAVGTAVGPAMPSVGEKKDKEP